MRLLSLLARDSSRRHHFDFSQERLTMKMTASQRLAASCRARSQRSPAATPRLGSRSRNRSDQPAATSQSRSAMASALLNEECEMKIRDTGHTPGGTMPEGHSIG